MNHYHRPVGSEVTQVDFTFLPSSEIVKISVVAIENPVAIDNLGHPTKAGLYDASLGAILKKPLPTTVYHTLFFKQLLVLLRAACLYCFRFRLSAAETHRYACKLLLLQQGYLIEAAHIDSIRLRKSKKNEAEDVDRAKHIWIEDLLKRREDYIRKTLRKGSAGPHVTSSTILQEKKLVVREFLQTVCKRKRCDTCGAISPTFRVDGFTKIFEIPLNDKAAAYMQQKGFHRPNVLQERGQNGFFGAIDSQGVADDETIDVAYFLPPNKTKTQRYVCSTEVRNTLRMLFKMEHEMFDLLFNCSGMNRTTADSFFLKFVLVPPNKFRPADREGDVVRENAQNDLLKKILQSSIRIKDLHAQLVSLKPSVSVKGNNVPEKFSWAALISAFVALQQDVNNFMDSAKAQSYGSTAPLPGVKQLLEKKEGLFRKHMMGKRVNYAARSVISPDPNIETNEIGVPPVFASKLTYPEPVTPFNVTELRTAVINGPDKWPGATHIQVEDGRLISLLNSGEEKRTALANQLLTPHLDKTKAALLALSNKKVYRHLRNGDIVLMNRQPTLHKPSMMAHKVRVLPGEKTLRLHYANCNSYNADFDGDEMNMHFPQNELARSEAYFLANTDSQYLVPTSGQPLRGLIQDHVVSGVWLTMKDTFLTREEYMQVIYGSVRPEFGEAPNDRVIICRPAIFRPQLLWTGKQVISTVLLNLKPVDYPGLNLDSKSKVGSRYWGRSGAEEDKVIFRDGELLCGILDKSQFGASAFGLVHSIYELYGSTIAGKLLSILGRLFTKFSQIRGFTCRMDDLRLTPSGDRIRHELIYSANHYGAEVAKEYTNAQPDNLHERLEEVLRDDEKMKGLDASMRSKMNGLTSSVINQCIPDGLLIKFPENHMQTMTISGAKGSNVNVSQISCLLGQQELEGRRVPIMASGKSLPSFKAFDPHARAGGFIAGRFLTGIPPQEYYFHCMAGREGLIDTAVKTSRSGYLQRCLIKHLEGVAVKYDNTVRDSDGSLIQFLYGEDALDVTKQTHLMDFKFSALNYMSLIQRYSPKSAPSCYNSRVAIKYAKKAMKKPWKYAPVMSVYSPSRFFGSISEKYHDNLEKYIKENPDKLLIDISGDANGPKDRLTAEKFRALMHFRYAFSLAEPGEAVGIIASQSVGEPSTQMTLNTFHFAGFGAKNVTLGIPRLREIVMTASAMIKTPSMTLKLNPDISMADSQRFCKMVSKLVLSQLTDHVTVKEKIAATGSLSVGEPAKVYTIRFTMFNPEDYMKEHHISQNRVESALCSNMLHCLAKIVSAAINTKRNRKQRQKVPDFNIQIGVPQKILENRNFLKKNDITRLDASDDDEDLDDDTNFDDAAAKPASRSHQAATYDAPDDDDEELIQEENRRESKLENLGDEDSGVGSDLDDDERSKYENLESKPSKRETMQLETARKYYENVRAVRSDANGLWYEFELEYPSSMEKILMLDMVEKACRQTILQEMPGIKGCFLVPPETKSDPVASVTTEGVNIDGMWAYQGVVLVNNIYTNDIAAILRVYGVEAARNAIVNEISGVFGVYGIGVDPRHLSLIADYMTFGGGYRPFSRIGIDSNPSPFLKMSFETTCAELTKAVIMNQCDRLTNPSAQIVVGQPVGVGTHSFEVLNPLDGSELDVSVEG